jgi:hypothetical protein
MDATTRPVGPSSPLLRIVNATYELAMASQAYRDQVARELGSQPDLSDARELVDQLQSRIRTIADLARSVGLYFEDLPPGSRMAPAISLLTLLEDEAENAEATRKRAWAALADVAA